MSNVLGIDVGGTNTRYGVVKNDLVSSVEKLFTKDITDFPSFVSDLVEKNPEIDVISIGIPGICKNNKIISLPNLKKFEIKDMDEVIYKKTQKKVIINKDVNLLFANDLHRLNLSNRQDVLGFYIGTGLGNAVKIGGKIHFGENGFSGELGHIPILGNQLVCGCGKTGCAETIVSGKALVNIHKDNHLTGSIKDIFTNHKDNPLIQTFIENLGLLISMEINILDILNLVIAGGVINMPNFPKEKLTKIIIKNLRSQELVKDLNVFYVDDSPINSIMGASLIIKENK